jgi:penicillin amidase
MSVSIDPSSERLRAALPELTATLQLPGLHRPVTIWRDGWGISHVQAETRHDTFFGQGFAQAQDRLWQMEYDRRRATGRWAEVVGPGALVMDAFARRARLAASAQADYAVMNTETRAVFDAYAAGVNAFINSTDTLPIEYAITGIEPEPWKPWHSCAVYKIRHILMGTWQSKLFRARVLKHLGPELIHKLRSETLGEQTLVVPSEAGYRGAMSGLADLDAGLDAISRLPAFDGGSNNWAVHGSRTASGKPIVAGDPHRGLDVPNVYYQNHLRSDEFDVAGLSFVGVPGFPHFGHNQRVAWCVTHANADYQDLYVERFNPENPAEYEFEGRWLPAERRKETIQVKDGEPVELEITITRHGPVVIGDPASGHALSLRYTAICQPNHGFGCLLPMLTVRSVDELDAVMRDWVDPCNNYVMADVQGTVGYLTRGQIPVRAAANGWLPVPGWSRTYDWKGVIPFEELPRLRDPEAGFVVTANNRITGQDYPHYINVDFSPPSRAQRIVSRLQELEPAEAAQMRIAHGDRVSIPSRLFIERLAGYQETNPVEHEALALLNEWDGALEADSPAASVYIVTRDQLTRRIAGQPRFQALWTNPFAADEPPASTPAAFVWWVLPGLLRENDTSLLPEGEDWETAAGRAFREAVAWLRDEFGDDPADWQWGRLHRTNPTHPLALVRPELAELLNPPAVSIGGDGDTPQATHLSPGAGYTVTSSAVARYIFDLADWNESRWIVPLGSSGHPGSPHYADQAELWSRIEDVPMLYDWEAIQREAETVQTLEPFCA